MSQKETRRSFVQKAVTSSIALAAAPGIISAKKETSQASTNDRQGSSLLTNKEAKAIWRNKKDGMNYRMLGRTGMMISEICMGTFPMQTEDFYPVLDASLEKGVNYFDSAAAYGKGKVEENLGNYFKQRGNRQDLFLTTKLSGYGKDRFFREIYNKLSSKKQEALQKQANKLLEDRMVLRPGYHFNYFGGQEQQLKSAYLWYVVLQEYGMKNEWKPEIKKHAYKLLEESLKRLQTDHVDVLFCPHGAASPELEDPILEELFSEFKQKGMISASAVSFHNDVTGNLSAAIETGYYDVAMFAYNIANHAAVDATMYRAKLSGMGLIAMKVAKLYTMKDKPEWITDKMNQIDPDENLSIYAKSYRWVLQNPNLSSAVSQMDTLPKLEDNLRVIS